jgi:hypothetical protein
MFPEEPISSASKLCGLLQVFSMLECPHGGVQDDVSGVSLLAMPLPPPEGLRLSSHSRLLVSHLHVQGPLLNYQSRNIGALLHELLDPLQAGV